MNIGEASDRCGLPPKTIRYYEDIGLITPLRAPNGYRTYRDSDLHKLSFLGRARALGFSIEDCRALMALYADNGRASADVKRIAQGHLLEIDHKIDALAAMRQSLTDLVTACAGDDRPDCPILRGIACGRGERTE